MLDDHYLEGGWEQVVFTIARDDARNDTMRYYKHSNGKRLESSGLSQDEYKNLPPSAKAEHSAYREKINHPNIRAPLETGWGYTDFDEQMLSGKIGIPELPGQPPNR